MSDGQFAALMTVLTAFGAAFIGMARWAVTRITNVIEENSKSHKEQTAAFAVLSTKIDFVYGSSQKVNDFMVEENSDVHRAAEEPSIPRRQTPPRGYPVGPYSFKRSTTRGGDE